MKNNPLLSNFDTPPFAQIENHHYKPAFEKAIKMAEVEIEAIVKNPETASFKNTIEALEYSGKQLSKISAIFFNLNSAETNDEIQKIAQEISPKLAAFSNDITLNIPLFEKVKQVYENTNKEDLNPEQQMLLEKNYKSFTRNGALLNEEDKNKLREIDKQLSQKTLQYGQNLLADGNAFELLLTKEDLDGLPANEISAARNLAKAKNKKGYLITLDYPSYIPFMKYAKNRELRKKLSIAFGAKGFQDNQYNNEQLIKEIVQLRLKRAQLLGYKNHAHFVLEERMAKSTDTVYAFLEDLLVKAKPAALSEFKQLENIAKDLDQIEQLEKWDSAYYSEKLKQQLFNIDDEALKPYFELKSVEKGAFEIAKRLFGLKFVEINNVEKYHEDICVYQVFDSKNNNVALLYTDYHPREGKRAGAWMTSFKSQQIENEVNERPQISIVCNFTKATDDVPALLTFNEVTTLFHEFGHALHGMLANTTYPSLSGTSVYWDFVELPSQLLENWCYEEEALQLFAQHYQTGAVIPMEIIEKIKASASFQQGMATLRQISFGMLDMAWHTTPPNENVDIKAFEKSIFKDTQLFRDIENNCMSTSFAHIFQGGYSSGYYSYKWAEVLDADAFDYFKQEGVFNKKVANKLKTEILEKGGTAHPETLYLKFRGKKPSNKALLKRAGLI